MISDDCIIDCFGTAVFTIDVVNLGVSSYLAYSKASKHSPFGVRDEKMDDSFLQVYTLLCE